MTGSKSFSWYPTSMSSLAGFDRIARTLRQPNFRIYAAGSTVSLIGTWMQRIAVGWLTWELTGSGFWLGLVACADLLPVVLVGPFGGVLADRLDRRRIIMAAQGVALLVAGLLFALTLSGAVTVEALALLILANGVATGFYQPARMSLIPALLPREDLSSGIAITAIIFNLARFVGPALAGGLIVGVGVAWVFAANAASFLAFIVAVSRLRLDASEAGAATGVRPSVLDQLREGVGYTFHHPGIGPLLLLLTIASLGLRPFVELMPGFAAEVFAGGAGTLAVLSSSVGVGAVIAGAVIAQRGAGSSRLVLLATLVLVAAILGFIASDVLWLATLCASLAGMAMVTSGVTMQTLLHLAVDGAKRGRVLGLYGMIFVAGPAAGALIMGSLSEATGLRAPLAGGAALVLLVWARLWSRRARLAAALEREPPPGP